MPTGSNLDSPPRTGGDARQPASPRWLNGAILALLLLGTLRAALLLWHTPLLAYANSYDQTRYTACFDLYPARPANIEPTRNSPEAPFSRYAFIDTDDPLCYWSSDLVLQATTVAAYHVGEWLAPGDRTHSVRLIGVLRLGLLLAMCALLSRAWLRRGEPAIALGNAALLPLLFADPANALYLSTFYAEWTALLALYGCLSLILLYDRLARFSRRAFVALALAALLLATSKIQHMLLPLALALVSMLCARLRGARIWRWQNLALLLGALGGLYFQFVQLQRGGDMMATIRQYNNADVLLTALLPAAPDATVTARELGIDSECLAYNGKSAWQLPNLPNQACPGLINFTRGRELAYLLRHPGMLGWIGWHGVIGLQPWMAGNIGHVEGGEFAKLDPAWGSLSHLFDRLAVLLPLLFLLPGAVLLVLLSRARWRAHGRLLLFTALTATTQFATVLITVLGDGLADTAKQGGLAVNAGIGWVLLLVLLALWRAVQPTPTTPSISTSSSARQTSP